MNLNQSNLFVGKEAQDLLKYGIDGVADAVKLTIGAKGRNAILQDMGRPGHRITNDGISIANHIHFKDPVAEMGGNIIREVAKRADDQSGDGTTTAMVLAQAIINEGLKLRGDKTGIEIKRELDALLPEMEKIIDDQSIPCVTHEDMKQIGTISAENEDMGKEIADIYETIGNNGWVDIDNSRTPLTTWEEIKGVKFPGAKLASPAFASDYRVATQEEPLIFVTTQPLRDPLSLKPLLTEVASAQKSSFVLIVDDIDDKVLQFILQTNIKGGCNIVVVRPPTVDKDAFFEDVSKATGATILNAKSGVLITKATLGNAGMCDKITITLDSLTIAGGKDLTDHKKYLEETLDQDTPLLKERLARLSATAAHYQIGGLSESDLSYKKAKAIDAVNAVKLALEGGSVAGGGVALLNVSNALTDATIGSQIMKKALKEPISQIIRNFGIQDFDVTYETDFGGRKGFDAKEGKVADMVDAGIIDAAKIVKNSLRSAVSVAGTFLTSDICVILPEPKQQFIVAPPQQ